jgi:hypothetical protein
MLGNVLNFPDIRSWPTAAETNFSDISLVKEKGSLLYPRVNSSWRGMVLSKLKEREKGLAAP